MASRMLVLPGSVRAVDVVACGVERELDLSQAPEIGDRTPAQRQLSRTPARAYRRIGMTTNFVLLPPGSRIRQLEFESVHAELDLLAVEPLRARRAGSSR